MLFAPEQVTLTAAEEAQAVVALAELLAARLAVRGAGVSPAPVDNGDPAQSPRA